MNILFKNKLIPVVFSTLFVSQICLAAMYTPPDGVKPGSIEFVNVQVDAGNHISAILTATDNNSIHTGQIYQLNLDQLGLPLGEQDATYNFLNQKVESQNVIQTSNQNFDLILQMTELNITNNSAEFTLIQLRSKIIGDDNQLVEQVTSFMSGPKGDTGPQGEKGDVGRVGPMGLKGVTGPMGPEGLTGPDGSFPAGNALGEMQYWNGTEWSLISVPEAQEALEGSRLVLCDGVPRWSSKTHKIGDRGPAGGHIFYVDGCGGGMEAGRGWPLGDRDFTWGCTEVGSSSAIEGANGAEVGDGAVNTEAILKACSAGGHREIAAEYANNYEQNGYTDWFLPSKGELILMYNNIGPGGGILSDDPDFNRSGGIHGDVYYWSSTVLSVGWTWALPMKIVSQQSTGTIGAGKRWSAGHYVRPARAF